MANKNINDIRKEIAYEESLAKQRIDLLESEKNSLSTILNYNKKIQLEQEIQNEKLRIAKLEAETYNKMVKDGHTFHANTVNAIAKQNALLEQENKKQETKLKLLKNIGDTLKGNNAIANKMFDSLMLSDKVIRDTILNLSLSGTKANIMRQMFYDTAYQVSVLGGSLKDIQAIQQGFANETGRAQILTKEMAMSVFEIGKGTGLGIENATKLAAKFELIGIDAKKVKDLTQLAVNIGEKYSINVTAALSNIERNFKTIQTYTFAGGSKSIFDMALNAEKFRISMESTFNVMEKTRTLEGSIEAMAKLQVLGGEFAKTDPFQMLFLSRNDPKKFQDKLVDLTKNVVTFRREADGTFSKILSPADRDRLTSAATALGLAKEELIEMANRNADFSKIGDILSGKGLTADQKEIIKGAAKFDSEAGAFFININGAKRNIIELTNKELELYATRETSLEKRAKQAQDFNSALEATINSFKASLLPMLNGINWVLDKTRPIFETISEMLNKLALDGIGSKILGILGVGFAANKVISATYKGFANSLLGSLLSKNSGGISVRSTPSVSPTGGGSGGATSGFGGSAFGTGAGIGAAVLGIGAGVGAAAWGISKLSESLEKLDDKKVEALKSMVSSLGIVAGIGTIVAGAVMAIGISAGVAAPEIGLLSLGVLGIGAGIGIAASGIGYMSKGLADLVNVSKDSGTAMLNVGAGIAAINMSMAAGGIGGSLFGGFNNLKKTLDSISDKAPKLQMIGNAFKEINTLLSGNKDDYKEIETIIKSIASTQISKDSVIAKLTNLLDKPLKVEFDKKEVNLVSNITLNIDGEKFVTKTIKSRHIAQIDINHQKGIG